MMPAGERHPDGVRRWVILRGLVPTLWRLFVARSLTKEMFRMLKRRDSGPAGGRAFLDGESGTAGMPGRGRVAVAWFSIEDIASCGCIRRWKCR